MNGEGVDDGSPEGSLPPKVAAVLERYGVASDTKAALIECYIPMGGEVFEVFIELAERLGSPGDLRPEHLVEIRGMMVERFLRRRHPEWLAGKPTPGFWHPRETAGRASGLVAPLGSIRDDASEPFSMEITARIRKIIGANQPMPEGMIMFGKNAHFGGRAETVSFDVMPFGLEDALSVALAEGRQHTIPGSVGETSGTLDSRRGVLLIWEIQPNVLKPAAERNRSIRKIYRQFRNWHIATLAAAIVWARARNFSIYIVKGEALAATHEVNARQPVSERIAELHEMALDRVARGLGFSLEPADLSDRDALLESALMNTGLRRRVESVGIERSIWKLWKE
ncbi:MAG TPA: hypothetical protein VNM92_08140 [Thermoanaerobaculia bacterium]|nr:hypothetical protein [Thermoanaerobaculia bacterium]